ncbi:zinc finger, CCHC-type containing protein [Tanacetum coccineum]|uniref:Zinc finger, CCHC-type containing protein n=1 Tax=Tanacetum coccineum TaxID=301880 RepID=A0ABQ4XUM4_9ASTR
MKGIMDQLHTLGKPYDNDMAVNLINRSLNKDFGDFVRNFNMHCVGKTVTELHALLIDFEKGLKDKAPTPQVFTIQKGRDNKPKPQANKKVKGKGKADKNKQVVPYQPKPKPNPLKRKENPNKDQACHHCQVAGHWKRNCPLYIEELHVNKKFEPGAAVSVYGGNPDTELEVTGFCDASWQCDKDDTKSQTGYVFVVNGGSAIRDNPFAMHATQSEYMAASKAAMEAVWIRKFVGDPRVMPSINKLVNMYCDNFAAITFANEPGVMKGARHFLRRYHYVREQVESGEIKLIKVHTVKTKLMLLDLKIY